MPRETACSRQFQVNLPTTTLPSGHLAGTCARHPTATAVVQSLLSMCLARDWSEVEPEIVCAFILGARGRVSEVLRVSVCCAIRSHLT